MRRKVYAKCLKPFIGRLMALIFVILFSWLYLVLAIIVRIKMGSPVFLRQERPGIIDPRTGKEKIFKLYKFRTMLNTCDDDGNLLPDEERLTSFGRKLRSTSLDELPEILFNILLFGNMAWIGPRPLLVRYLGFYTDEERKRHTVKPGLTGLAQINGRNNLGWDERLALDVKYVENISIVNDCKIALSTVGKILKKSDIAVGNEMILKDLDDERGNMF